MRPKPVTWKTTPGEQVAKDIRRATRCHFSAEDKIRIVLDGLRGQDSIAEICRKERIAQSLCYVWSKAFLEAGKWKARVIHILSTGRMTFAPLRRALQGISQQVLSAQLQALVADGLVARTQGSDHGAGSRYALTPVGRSLLPVLKAVAAWGEIRRKARGVDWEQPVLTVNRRPTSKPCRTTVPTRDEASPSAG